jgi:hypothetical protein
VLGDFGIDEFAPVTFESCEGAFLVNTHQATVAGDIGCEDSSQSSVDARLGHNNRPDLPWFRTELMI